MTFATLRLGKTSVEDIRLIDAQESGILTSPMTISVVCTQVPADLLPGTYTFLWLGSDNSKGMPTTWKQGFKALGVVRSIDREKNTMMKVPRSLIFLTSFQMR